MKKIAKIIAFLCLAVIAMPNAKAQISISVRIGPPELPYYVQPPCPYDGYLWEPGYWAYDDADGYYWVPGVWVMPPDPDYYWTPPYWGYSGGFYGFHRGYWGRHVGYYGGIDYGYGYSGYGFTGGRWSGRTFRYNTAVVNVNRTVVHNTYIDRTAVHNVSGPRKSFNGPGGVTARPRPQELAAMKERHIQPTARQLSHQQAAAKNRSQFASVNHGHPAAAAMSRINGRAFNPQGHPVPASSLQRSAARPGRGAAARPNFAGRSVTPARAAIHQRVQQERPQQQRVQQERQQRPQPQQRPQQQFQRQQQQRPQPQQRQQQQQRPPGGGHERHG